MKTRILLVALLALAVSAQSGMAQRFDAIDELSGTYETTIEVGDVLARGYAGPIDLVGGWTLTLREDGHIVWTYEAPCGCDSYGMNSVYVVHDGRLLIGVTVGRHRARDAGVTAGVYAWSWQDDALVLEAVDDGWLERRIVLTAHPLAPVE
jgi:hypothetical protein